MLLTEIQVAMKMHVSLYSSNINKTVEFYETLFGQKADKLKVDYAKFELDDPALVISFVENPQKVSPQFGHLGFRVESIDEVSKKLGELQSQGIPVKEEMSVSCCYALQDKFWVMDPDGHHWEVYSFSKDVDQNDPEYQSESEEAGCSPKEEKKKVSLSSLSSKQAACVPGSGCC